MVALVVLIAIVLLLAAGAWYGLRGQPNSPQEMDRNSPYPSTVLPPVSHVDEIEEGSADDPHIVV